MLTITTSWDDGHPLDLRIAGMLRKYGLAGTFYVPLHAERGVLKAEQIRDLASDFEIGAHTVHHLPLTELTREAAWQEILQSRKQLEDITGRKCLSFCFPMGKFRRVHLPMLHQAGFVAARTVQMMSLDPPRSAGGIFLMPTTVQVFPHTAAALFRNAAKRLAFSSCSIWLRHCRRFDWVPMVDSFLRFGLRQGGVFHLWGHSWEIEERNQWSRLEEALRMLGELQGSAEFVTNAQVCGSPGLAETRSSGRATHAPLL